MQRSTTVHEPIADAAPLGVIAALLDALGTPVFVCGRSGRILVANEPAKHCIGERAGEGRSAAELF